jgi:hypothetical protein
MGGFAGPGLMDTRVNAGNLKRGRSSGLMAYEEEGRFPIRGDFQLTELEVYCNDEFKGLSPAKGSWWPF